MGRIETYKLIERIVAAIDRNIYVTDVAQIGTSNRYIVSVHNTKWIPLKRAITIGTDNYKVVDIDPGASFTIELATGQTAPAVVDFVLPAVHFDHGTYISVNKERTEQQKDIATYQAITPMIYYNEPAIDREVKEIGSSISRYSDCTLYFMNEADFDNWTNDQHYKYVIAGMSSLIDEFIKASENSSFVGEITDDFNSENHVMWGVLVDNKGHMKNILNETLSGKKLNITIPFLKDTCCTDPYVAPSEGGSATVRNSDNTYNVEVQAGDTLILPDDTFNVYVDGVLQDTLIIPSLAGADINIIWT